MGQACSSANTKHKNKASQKRKNESASQNYKENANNYYAQGNIAIPHEPIPQAESKIVNEKTGDSHNEKQLYRPENESEHRYEKHGNHQDDEKDELELSQEKAQQEFSFGKEGDNFEGEIGKIHKKRDLEFANNPSENNEPQSYQTKAKNAEDDSFEEEEKKDNDDSCNLYDENRENQSHHFRHLQREEQNTLEKNAEPDCPICLESFATLGEEPTFTICGHAFCFRCLRGALKIHPYCPLCRAYQSKPLYDANGQQLYGLGDGGPLQPLSQEQWNVEVVRAHIREIAEEGHFNRRVFLSNGEATNIYVGKGAKINVSPNANLFINGKRVENPQDCNVQ